MSFGSSPFGSAPFGAAEESLVSVIELISFADTHDIMVINAILESLVTGDDVQVMGRFIGDISDLIRVRDKLTPILMQQIQESLALGDVALADVYRLVAISDSLVMADALGLSLTNRVSDTLALAYILKSIQLGQVTDSLLATESLTALASVFEVLSESLLLQSQMTGLAVFTVLAEDTLGLDDDLSVRANYLASIADGLGFSVSLVIDGIPFLGMTMNTETKGVTQYSNYGFNSIANFNGVLYGANEVGLFRLDGETDNGTPIEAYARTGLQRVAAGKQARVDCAYIGYRSDGTMQMKVTISGDRGQKLSYIYDMQEVVAESTRPNRVKFGRGLKAAYWSFQISNTGGADFDVDIIEIHPIPLERRVP